MGFLGAKLRVILNRGFWEGQDLEEWCILTFGILLPIIYALLGFSLLGSISGILRFHFGLGPIKKVSIQKGSLERASFGVPLFGGRNGDSTGEDFWNNWLAIGFLNAASVVWRSLGTRNVECLLPQLGPASGPHWGLLDVGVFPGPPNKFQH